MTLPADVAGGPSLVQCFAAGGDLPCNSGLSHPALLPYLANNLPDPQIVHRMATVARPQAIAGVSAQAENVIMTVWPSVAATLPGRVIGMMCDSIPLKLNGIKLSYLLFALPLSPIALLIYFGLKIGGSRYILTNRAIDVRAALGTTLRSQAALTEIETVTIERQSGQAFYHAGDLVVWNAAGDELLRLGGVPRPDVFRQSILEARDARQLTEASLLVIGKRQGG